MNGTVIITKALLSVYLWLFLYAIEIGYATQQKVWRIDHFYGKCAYTTSDSMREAIQHRNRTFFGYYGNRMCVENAYDIILQNDQVTDSAAFSATIVWFLILCIEGICFRCANETIRKFEKNLLQFTLLCLIGFTLGIGVASQLNVWTCVCEGNECPDGRLWDLSKSFDSAAQLTQSRYGEDGTILNVLDCFLNMNSDLLKLIAAVVFTSVALAWVCRWYWRRKADARTRRLPTGEIV